MKKTNKAVWTVALVLAVALPVAAGTALLTYDPHQTQNSGHTGQTKLLTLGSNTFLTGIQWCERSDNPCGVRLVGLKFVGGQWQQLEKDFTFGCTWKDASTKGVKLYHPGTPDALGIKGIKVCTSDKKESDKEYMKGIKVWATKVKKNGNVVNDNGNEESKRTNCSLWHDKVECADGEVATGLKVRYRDLDGEPDAIRGMSLQCSKVRAR